MAGDEEIPVILMPSWSQDLEDLDALEGFMVLGTNLRLQEVCVLRPTLQLDTEAYGMRRWLQPFVPQPWSKGSRRTARLALVDAVHHLLQTAHDGLAQGVVAHGEA